MVKCFPGFPFLMASVGSGLKTRIRCSLGSASFSYCEVPRPRKASEDGLLLIAAADELCGKQRNGEFVVASNRIATTGAIGGRAAHDVG